VRVYKGATIYPVDGPRIETGTMVVEDGKIKAIGGPDTEVPEEAEIVDLSGKVILPGFVDAHSHVGVWGDGEGPPSYDGNEGTDAVTAKVRALDAANPEQLSFANAREGGITSLQIVPGSGNPIGGLGFACKTKPATVIEDLVIKDPTGLKGALGENPKRAHGQGRKQAPMTRMGTAGIIREYFNKAREYMEKMDAAGDPEDDSAKKPDYDMNLEPGVQVLRGELPFRVHAHRYDDIATVVRLCEELGIAHYSIEHCTTGYMIADYLGSRGVIAHVGPGLFSRGKEELTEADERNPVILDAAGVKVCLMTDHPFLDSRYLLVYAGIVNKHGMPLERVLRAITLNAAESLGIEDRVGSLTPGKDADFVVLSGEPFTYTSVILSTYVEGREVYTRPTL